ncbi:MAG: DNA repair protein RecN [Alphaproteobacteria bacterium]|nr:DNA repair protein RecN [Alphaproteobacteria bacterium]
MLKSLSIRNVILIDKLDWDLQNGFTVLSGETGAGKSILLDALGLVLGSRADVGMIRSGCDKLSVCGCFETADRDGALARLCAEHELDFDREILIKRTLSDDGRGKIFFNDQPITQKLLKDIGNLLVEIHGQFDNQGLLNPATHLQVLDNYGGYEPLIKEMSEAFAAYKKIKNSREKMQQEIADAKRDEENMRHWLDEFNLLKPREGEVSELEQKRQQLMNAEKILENLNLAHRVLYAQGISVHDALRQAQAALARANTLMNNRLDNIYELLDTAMVNAEEADEEIESVSTQINLSQHEIDAVEERLFALKDLARKHHVTVEDLPQTWKNLEEQMLNLEHGENDVAALERQEKAAFEHYCCKAQNVHEERLNAARHLDAQVMKELPDLKMEKACFKTEISERPAERWNESGFDDVCFIISTNPNTPFGPLNKIASGGELARFMLALKVNLAQTSQIETMIFDEVDSGVGGATAQAVGDKLAALGHHAQVLVVTHSPQVAARSQHHFKVEKKTTDGVTTTNIYPLTDTEKNEEIARMLSGETITAEARAAANVLIGG